MRTTLFFSQILFFSLLSLPFIVHAQSVTRYIHVRKPAGSIRQAADTARPGDHIIVHTGTYDETIVLRASGISLLAAKGERVILHGGGIRAEQPIDHITIEGFTLEDIATGPADVEGEQPGAICTGGGTYWTIRKNTITHAANAAISIGMTGHPHTESKPNHPAYSDLPTDIEKVGHHRITGNRILQCGQAGIIGLLHGTASIIDSNDIEGTGGAAIRLAVAVDVVIRANKLQCDTGVFLGSLYQGGRISNNQIISAKQALRLFDSHGPLLIEHNRISGDIAMVGAEANVFVSNQLKGAVSNDMLPMRPWATSSFLPHSLVIKQTIPVLPLENRWDGNTAGIFPLTKQSFSGDDNSTKHTPGKRIVVSNTDTDYVAWPLNRISPSMHPQPFTHPGLLHSAADLKRIRDAVAKGLTPWKEGFAVFAADPGSSADYIPHPAAHVERSLLTGMGKHIGDLERDGNAAYQNALMWCITGEEAHAKKAVEILNGWSSTLQIFDGTDVELGAGLNGLKFANAAELIRYTYPAWKKADIARCQVMLKQIFYPPCQYFAQWAHGNWDLACMKAMMAIGIFCDDHSLFDRAVDYYYHGPGNGSLTHYIINDTGQVQESGRDQQHTQLGIGQLAEVCQMAWNQGLDLYSADNNRLLRGFEYVARYNLGEDVPFTPYRDKSKRFYADHVSEGGRGGLRAIYEMVLNHYEQAGISADRLKYTRMAADKLRPEGRGFGADHPGFGTLLFSLRPTPPASVYQYAVPVGGRTAFLWIPPHCQRIRGIIFAMENALELNWMESPIVRDEAEKDSLAMCWLSDGKPTDITWEMKPAAIAAIDKMFIDLATVSGYQELAQAPLIVTGHSWNGRTAWTWPAAHPERTIAAVPIRTYPMPDSLLFSGIPLCYIVGQTTELPEFNDGRPGDRDFFWPVVRRTALALRHKDPDNLIGVVTWPGGLHMDWSDEQSRFLALFIHKACRYRLPEQEAPDGRTSLRPMQPETGWLTDCGGMDSDRYQPAPYTNYKGPRDSAYWFFDKEMATTAIAFNGDRKKRRLQMLSFYQGDSLLPVNHNGYVSLAALDGSALDFSIHAGFLPAIPTGLIDAGQPLGHATPAFSYRVVMGPAIQTGPDRFRLRLTRQHPRKIMIVATEEADAVYRRASQPVIIDTPTHLTTDASRTINFPAIDDQPIATKAMTLKSTASAGPAVEYYVEAGPAWVDGDTLRFTDIPVRSRLPIKVTVVAYQWGKTLTRSFYLK